MGGTVGEGDERAAAGEQPLPELEPGAARPSGRERTPGGPVALEQFFELSLDKLCVARGGYFERVNPAWDTLGYTREELLSRPFIEFIHPDDRAATVAELEKLARGVPSVAFENRYRCKDGSYRWLVWNGAPDGAGVVYALAHDVTERKRVDEATRQTSLFLEAVLENIPHMVFVKDAERLAFVRFNRAGENLLGVSRDALLGKNDYDLFPETEAVFFQAKDRETLEGRVLVDIAEEPIQTKAGPRLLHTTKVPILDATGAPRYLLGISEDITQRKAGDEARARLAAIIEASDDAIVSKTIDGVVTSWNHGAEKIFGYTAEEAIGRSIIELIIPAEREEEEARVMRRLRLNERVGHFETVRRRKDGRLIDVSVALSALRDAAGRVIGISKIARDVTLAKRAAAERANLETRARAVLDTVIDGIVVIDDAGIVSTFNRGAERIFQTTAAEVVGKSIEAWLPWAEQSPRSRPHSSQHAPGSQPASVGAGREVIGLRKDGSRVPLELSVTEMSVDGKRHDTCVVRDISERKAAEAALARKNQELEVAARIDRIGARLMVALSKEEQTSTPASDVLRVLADEAGYRPLAFYDYDESRELLVLVAGLSLAPGYEPRSLRVGEGLVGEAAAQRQPVFVEGSPRAPFSLDTGVGVLTAATLFALPLIHRERLLGVVAGAAQAALLDRERTWLTQVAGQVAIGLSAIRQFQELKELSEQLEERSREIEAQNRELENASRLKSEFLASMSHELRTPLNAIIGFSEALVDGLRQQPQYLDYATEVHQNGRHLLALINDILDLSKIEAGKMDLDVERVDVSLIVNNALAILRERAAKGRVNMAQAVAAGVGSIDADARKLRQMIYNLLSNAVKFTPPGGWVRVEVTRAGDQLEFAVADSGIGIAPENIPRLFSPFEQLDAGIARKFEGTGLGLVMVKNLAELHGGSIGVESELGKGSRFWVRLPASRAELRPSQAAPAGAVSPSGAPSAQAAHARDVEAVEEEL